MSNSFMSIAQYAVSWRIGKYLITERYNRDLDTHHWGHPYAPAATEPVYGIHATVFGESRADYFSKSAQCFIHLPSPSNRTDEEMIDTSFTLQEAIETVMRLQQDHPDPNTLQQSKMEDDE